MDAKLLQIQCENQERENETKSVKLLKRIFDCAFICNMGITYIIYEGGRYLRQGEEDHYLLQHREVSAGEGYAAYIARFGGAKAQPIYQMHNGQITITYFCTRERCIMSPIYNAGFEWGVAFLDCNNTMKLEKNLHFTVITCPF